MPQRGCDGAARASEGMTWEQVVADLAALYGEALAEPLAKALWAAHVEGVRDGRLYMAPGAYYAALAALGEAHGASKPAWVDECIDRYIAQGLSEEEAAGRCYGAWHERGGKDATWQAAFDEAFAQTGDVEKAALAAAGARAKERYVGAVGLKREAGRTIVAGWGMLFTDEAHPDLEDEYFNRLTQTLLDYYPRAPLWYEHGEDPAYGSTPIGYRWRVEAYPRGIWVEHALHEEHALFDRTVDEARRGLLSYSSDTLAHHLRVEDDGLLSVWPVAGWSLTKQPAEPALGPVAVREFEKALKAARDGAQPLAVTEAREAQGRSVDMGDAHPDEANHVEESAMNEELLAALAAAFGVEPTQEAVEAAIRDFIETLQKGDDEEEEDEEKRRAGKQDGADEEEDEEREEEKRAKDVDLAALAAALGLPEDASREDLVDALMGLLQLLAEPAPEPAPDVAPAMGGGRIDYGALKQARQLAAKRAEGRVPLALPYMTGGGKSFNKAWHHNRGARPPGLADLVVAHVTGDSRAAKAAKAVGRVSGPQGTYMLDHIIAEEIIQPLYAQEVVMAAGARVERFEGAESITYRKFDKGAAAKWGGPGQVVGQSQPVWAVVTLHPKELVVEVPIHNKALKMATAALEQQIRSDVIKALRLEMDRTFLFGVGGVPEGLGHSGEQPLGLLHIDGVHKEPLGDNGLKPKFEHLTEAAGRIEDADVELGETTGWIMAPRTKRTFTNKTDTNGNPLLRDSWAGGEKPTLIDYPYYTTTQVPTNVTVGTNNDCSYIFLGVWEEFVVGISLDVEMVIDESVYRRQRMTLLQAVTYVDCGVFYPEAFDILTAVRP